MTGTAPVIAVIPARRGSKGLPLKNLRLLDGLPLVAHSIRAALAVERLDTVIVSTEDDEVAAIARQFGADVVKRPAELATDTAQNNGVVRHVLQHLNASNGVVTLLQPTSPLRTPGHIEACLGPLLRGEARSAMTVTPVEHHPGKAVVIENGLIEPFTNDGDIEARRQTMREVYRQNGGVYAIGVADFLALDRFFMRPCRAVIVPADDSIDIDSELDLKLAELIIQGRRRP